MHSSLAQKHVDYEVDFVDCQRLERVLEKLSLSQDILMAIEHIACTLQSSNGCSKFLSNHDSECAARDLHEILMHINKIRGFRKTASALQNRAKRASILVSLPSLIQESLLELIALVDKASGLPKNGLT